MEAKAEAATPPPSKKLKLKAQTVLSEEDQSGDELEGAQDGKDGKDGKGGKGGKGDEKPRKWVGDERISLIDADGEAMCHGTVEDAEPNLDVFGDAHKYVNTNLQKLGWWIHVKLTHATYNSDFTLDVDCVFSIEGVTLNSTARRIKSLCDQQDGVLIWWEYLVDRKISATVSKSRKSTGTSKGASKKKHKR
jgi:hypothetical protein